VGVIILLPPESTAKEHRTPGVRCIYGLCS
jgi:hypothetical protein